MKRTSFELGIIFILFGCLGISIFGFTALHKDVTDQLHLKKYEFFGTNALYIEKGDGLKFNWITEKEAVGFYELIGSDNAVISKGKTALGRVHRVTVEHQMKENVIFRFGGQNTSVHQVKLRPGSKQSSGIFKKVDSLFVVGDVHGKYKELIHLLEKSRVINKELNWIAGKSHLVFLGDLFDRGNDVTKVLWFIYELEAKAALAGGKVHLVLGNHEIMTMTNDLRYLGAKEATIAAVYKVKYDEMFHPSRSFLGAWLSAKPSVLKIDKNLLAHGGVVDLGTSSVKEFNQTVNSYMKDPMFLEIMEAHPDSTRYDPQAWVNMKYFFYNENSPFWYRGYVYQDTLAKQLTTMLKKYRSNMHIVAHTPLETITQKYQGKLLTTDLKDAATELLLLVKQKQAYARYKIDSQGIITELE